MHIPDGFLDTTTSVVTWTASAGSVAYAVWRVNKELDERQVPLMGVSAAFIFAAQMLNFTVAGGTSGLDPRTRRNLIGLLRTLPQTMLVASHDMRLVWELCPRTVILDGGRIVADGVTAELLQDATLMERHGLETPFQAIPQA